MNPAPDFSLPDVSRETIAKLERFRDLLFKWNPAINLVSRSTLDDAWTRHFIDSAQVLALMPKNTRIWADLGSGGGFPGLVVAILAAEQYPGVTVHLVESDARKCAFLRTVLRETETRAEIHAGRIEDTAPLNAHILSARALAPLAPLLEFAQRHLDPSGLCLFQKGESWKKEADEARKSWHFSCIPHKSKTDPQAVVLQIGEIVHV